MPKEQYEASLPIHASFDFDDSFDGYVSGQIRLRKKSTEAEPKACFETRPVKGY